MKPSDYFKEKFQIYTGKDAETVAEMSVATGLPRTTLRGHIQMLVRSGVLKRVMVKRDGAIQRGYIKIK